MSFPKPFSQNKLVMKYQSLLPLPLCEIPLGEGDLKTSITEGGDSEADGGSKDRGI